MNIENESILKDFLSGIFGFIPSWLAFYGAAYLLGLDNLSIAIGTMLLIPFYLAVRYGAR